MPTGYYDYGPILSHNAVFNIVTGGRGIGKTYGAKKIAIDAYLKRGEQFMYVRRHKPDLKEARPKFLDDIIDLYPGYTFRIQGNELQLSRTGDKRKAWEIVGFFVALSVSDKLKSVPYPRVKRIIYDEYISESGYTRELPDEPTTLLNLYNTVDRNKDTTIVIMLANAVTIMNCYFMAWDIKPISGKITKYGGGFIAADFPSSDEYRKSIAGTRLSQFIEGTAYGAYAMRNEFADDTPTLIGRKTSEAYYVWSIECSAGTYSIWRDDNAVPSVYYAQRKRPKEERVYVLDAANMDDGKVLAHHSDAALAATRTAYRHARIRFDSPTTRNALLEIFKR